MESSATAITYSDLLRTAPGTLAGRYMRTFWHPVCRSEDLPAGRARPLKIMSEDFTLYRGETGTPHAVAFRCPHRGTQLSTGWVEGDEIRCFYHGWKYDGNGQCIEQPAEPEPFCQRIKVRSYPVKEYLGAIFAYLGEGEPPAMWSFPEFEGPGRLRTIRQVWPCNYFQRVENSLDHVHGAFVHRVRTNDYGLGEVPKVYGFETPYGIKEFGIRSGHVRMMHFHMPNLNYRPPWAAPAGDNLPDTAPDPEAGAAADLVWRVPVDDGSVASYLLDYLSPEALASGAGERRTPTAAPDYKGYDGFAAAADAVLRGETAIEALRGMTGMTNVEDYVAQVGQGTIQDRSQERLGRSDVLVSLLRRLWTRDLQALAEGKSPTQWRCVEMKEYERSHSLAFGERLEESLLAATGAQ